MTCQEFLNADANLWKCAIDHQFLKLCKDAAIPPASFNWWLEQDFGFAFRFADFIKAFIPQAPAQDQPALEGGLEALDDELVFFQA